MTKACLVGENRVMGFSIIAESSISSYSKQFHPHEVSTTAYTGMTAWSLSLTKDLISWAVCLHKYLLTGQKNCPCPMALHAQSIQIWTCCISQGSHFYFVHSPFLLGKSEKSLESVGWPLLFATHSPWSWCQLGRGSVHLFFLTHFFWPEYLPGHRVLLILGVAYTSAKQAPF